MGVTQFISVTMAFLSVVGGLCAYIKGRSKRKITSKLSQVEQENDLWDYMVVQIKRTETKSKFLKGTMSKEELSKYKKEEVLEKLELYAKGNQYTWFTQSVWSKEIDSYLDDAKQVQTKI